MQVITIGLDIAKSVFQVHGVDARGDKVLGRRLSRAQVAAFFAGLPGCVVGLEACGSGHYWARELRALGHDVRLIPPIYVKPYVRRNKTDAADAAAICEAVSRPGMRFVAIKTPSRQAVLSMHKLRALLMNQRTRTINALRGHLMEYGVVAAKGRAGLAKLLEQLAVGEFEIPDFLLRSLRSLVQALDGLEAAIDKIDREITAWHRSDRVSRQLARAPGFGVIVSSAVASGLTDPKAFKTGRDFAASLGLTPRIDGSGGKDRLGAISKRGDKYLRRLLVNGAMAVLNSKRARTDPWIARLLATKPRKIAAVAVANKMARLAWAMIAHDQDYRPGALAGL